MPYTVVVFAWRKPGLTPAQFKDHYEHSHIPLLLELAGPNFPTSHTRFYLPRRAEDLASADPTNENHRPAIFAGQPGDFPWDAYAELVFDDLAAFNAFHAIVTEPENAARIAADEEKFLDRTKLKIAAIDSPVVTTRPTQ
ncbi:hypothetical protein VTN00DRAFT_1119 [Thermoascus crustaceus]|uniref:uncharacterized protein n=1 Tax=Thermoascus crustaceus TaxID=5088 RepID=UPI0037421296